MAHSFINPYTLIQIWIFKFWNTGNRHYWEEQSFVITLDQEKENRRMVKFEYPKLQIQLRAKGNGIFQLQLSGAYLAASGQGAELPSAGVVVYLSLSNE